MRIAEILNRYFAKVTESLRTKEKDDNALSTEGIVYPTKKSIEKFLNHSRLSIIKNKFMNVDPCASSLVLLEEMDIET